jgi:uncharacterized protein (TIGR03118 family)
LFYQQHGLVSDGYYEAPVHDRDLVNPWGLVPNPTAVWWVADNGAGKSTLYDGNGNKVSLTVDVPSVSALTGGPVTGVTFNTTQSFVVTDGVNSGPAVFLFATEDGVISGWNPGVPPPPVSHQAEVGFDNSSQNAIYKGLAVASTVSGDRLYAADFHNARIDVLDGSFHLLNLPGAFVDPAIPDHYAPFNVMNLGGRLYVTYALQDSNAEDELAGFGRGYVSVFSTDGVLQQSLIHGGQLNAPWGMAIAPSNFGQFSNALLVGNFGNGRIHAYDPVSGALLGTLRRPGGSPIHVDGLWGIAFGNGGQAGPLNTLYFTAGPADETHGAFGRIDVQ